MFTTFREDQEMLHFCVLINESVICTLHGEVATGRCRTCSGSISEEARQYFTRASRESICKGRNDHEDIETSLQAHNSEWASWSPKYSRPFLRGWVGGHKMALCIIRIERFPTAQMVRENSAESHGKRSHRFYPLLTNGQRSVRRLRSQATLRRRSFLPGVA